MTTMLERMKARLSERQRTSTRDNSIYTFWNLKFGNSVTVRLLPYNDQYTGAFWSEKVMVPMQFTDPNDDSKVVKVSVPCAEMYDHRDRCPLLGPVRDLYAEAKELKNTGQSKDAERLEKVAGFHWKKPTYFYQGFVVKGGFEEETVPENPIRIFPFNKKIHRLIYDSIFENDEDPFEILPCGEYTEDDVRAILESDDVDLDKFLGFNFIVKKMQQGKYADWTTASGWSKKAEPLETEQLAAIAEHGFFDLAARLPQRPTDEQYAVMVEMMETSIQRQLSGENGVWNPEWEEATGVKPFRERDRSSGGDTKKDDESKPATSSARASSASANAEKAGGVDEAMSRLRNLKGRGKDEGEESPADVAAEADSTDAPEASDDDADSTASDLSARIRARIGKSA